MWRLRFLAGVLALSFLVLFSLPTIVRAAPLPGVDQDSIDNDTVHWVPNVPGQTGCTATATTTAQGTIKPGSNVYILGDSITVRTAPDYKTAFNGMNVTVSAVSGRSWTTEGNPAVGTVGTQGTGSAAADADAAAIGTADAIIIALGTNGYARANPINAILEKFDKLNTKKAPIWWVNVANVDSFTPGVVDFNTKLAAAAPGKFTVVPWDKTVDPGGDGTHNPKGILQDGTHPWVGAKGTQILAQLVVAAATGNPSVSAPNPVASTAGCSCSATSGSVALRGGTNDEKIFNFFIDQGFTAIQAAGIMGNAAAESGYRPEAVEPGGTGIGIFQWSFGRHDALVAAAKAANVDYKDLGFQLNYTMTEIRSRDAIRPAGGKEIDGLKKLTDIVSTVLFWENNFERSQDTNGDVATNPGLKKRVGLGQDALTKFGSNGAGSGSAGASCPQVGKSTSTTIDYEDTTRGRKLKTTIWTPSGSGPFPVIMFAHGFKEGPDSYKRYIQAIADKGFIVVAPSFPNADSKGILPLSRDDSLPKQPADIKFVLDQILKEPQLQGKIKADSIGMVGHSDGADDALKIGYSNEKDPRIKAVVAIAADDVSQDLGAGPPLLQMHGDNDSIAKYDSDLANYKKISASPKFFYKLLGADHFNVVAVGANDTPAVDGLTDAFLQMLLNGKPDTMNAIAEQYKNMVRKEN